MAPNLEIQYSEKYYDSTHEYRHVVLPPHIAEHLPPNRLLSEVEWRQLGVQQSRGWIHYFCHRPEPHILLFRRALTTDQAVYLAQQNAFERTKQLHQHQQAQINAQGSNLQQQQSTAGWASAPQLPSYQ